MPYAGLESAARPPASADTSHRRAEATRDSAPATEALSQSLNRSPQAQPLLQIRQALDEGPRVQSQLALQRALNRREVGPAPADAAIVQRAAAGVVQLGAMLSIAEPQPMEWDAEDIVAANREAYNIQQEAPPDRATLVATCIDAIDDLTDLSTLWELREVTDALVPVFSDAMLVRIREINSGPGKANKRRQRLYELKRKLLDYRMAIETQFQTLIADDVATLSRAALVGRANTLRGQGQFISNSRQIIQATVNKAPPNKQGNREPHDYTPAGTQVPVSDTRIDVRAANLVQAVRADGFLPDIVVGLPTGGVQIAARVAGIFHATQDALPVLMALRPRFVKDTGGAAFPADAQEAINAGDLQSQADAKGMGFGAGKPALNILVVDDFSSSGNSLAQAAEQLRRKFESLGKDVTVRTAVSRYTSAQLQPQVASEEGTVNNPIDYVAGQHGSGPRQAVHDKFHDPDGAVRFRMPEINELDQGWTDEGDAAIG